MVGHVVLAAVTSLALLTLGTAPGWSANRFVSTIGSDAANDCLMAATPCLTVGHALTQSTSGDTVKLAGGKYPANLVVDYSINLTLSGAWDAGFASQDGSPTILDGGRVGRVLSVDIGAGENTQVDLEDVTIQRGRSGEGGGIRAETTGDGGLSLSLRNVLLTRNRAETGSSSGGGLVARGSGSGSLSLTVEDSVVTKNLARTRGIYSEAGGLLISATDGTLDVTMSECTITKNKADVIAGAFIAVGGSASATLTVTNCVVMGNKAGGPAVSVFAEGGATLAVDILNSTLANNKVTVGSLPTQLLLQAANTASHVVNLRNDILFGRYGVSSPADLWAYQADTGTLIINADHNDIGAGYAYGGATFNDLGGNISADPLIVPRAKPRLSASSPCVDTGTCSGAPAKDFEGDTRPTGVTCDIGADELAP